MNTKLTLVLASILLSSSISASGGGTTTKPLANSNPIVLSHGILGFDDSEGLANGLVKYWGGMDNYLRSQGAKVLTPGKTSVTGIDVRAQQQKEQILLWMAANGFKKVNILAHSQGALDSRYMVSNLGMSTKVANITTVNGVNRGAPLADVVLGVVPSWLVSFVDMVVDFLGGMIYGDSDQDYLAAAKCLSIAQANAVNTSSPNAYGVKYFSYGSHMTWADPIQHPLMFLMYPITWAGGLYYGVGSSNDGVVPESSQKWGTWKGGPDYGIFTSGVDHTQAINFEWMGQTWYNVENYYKKMATNAMNNQ